MPAVKTNFIILHKNDSQVYSAGKKDIALSTPLPPHTSIEDRRIFFVSYEPDNERLTIRQIPQEEVLAAELKEKAPRKAKEVENEE